MNFILNRSKPGIVCKTVVSHDVGFVYMDLTDQIFSAKRLHSVDNKHSLTLIRIGHTKHRKTLGLATRHKERIMDTEKD